MKEVAHLVFSYHRGPLRPKRRQRSAQAFAPLGWQGLLCLAGCWHHPDPSIGSTTAKMRTPRRVLCCMPILTGSPLSSYMSCSIWDVVLIIFFIALSLFCIGKIYIQGTNHGKRNPTGLSRLVGPRPVTGGVSQDCPDGDPELLTPSVKNP